MTGRTQVVQWLNELSADKGLFLSVRFSTPPDSKILLCRRCRPIFQHLFRAWLGRHWRKSYGKQFQIIGFQEFGIYKNMHAHFILVCSSEEQLPTLVHTIKNLSQRLRMDVWDGLEDKLSTCKQYGDDLMIVPLYSIGGLFYVTKELRIRGMRIENDSIILDSDLFS